MGDSIHHGLHLKRQSLSDSWDFCLIYITDFSAEKYPFDFGVFDVFVYSVKTTKI